MAEDRILIGQHSRREHKQFVACGDEARKLAGFADRDETRACRFGAVLQIHDLAPDRIGEAGDRLAACSKREVQLTFDEARACQHAERRGHAAWFGLAIEN